MPICTKEFLKDSGILLLVAGILFLVSVVIGSIFHAPEIGFILGSILAYLSMIYMAGYLSEGIEKHYKKEIGEKIKSKMGKKAIGS